jgi:predicted transcriptional regulator
MSFPRNFLRPFRRPQGVSILGRLEVRVLEELWRRKEGATVRDVHVSFAGALAYTTLMTTLDRLHRKGVLDRHKAGRAYVYRPRLSREELERDMASDLIGGLLDGSAQAVPPVLSCIVDAVGERDRLLLDELDRLVREKRRRLKEGRRCMS